MSLYIVAGLPYSDELYHHGIKGQKWGIRRFENPDGTLTKEGKQRYRVNSIGEYRKRQLDTGKSISDTASSSLNKSAELVRKRRNKEANKVGENVKKMSDEELRRRINRIQMERQYSMLTSSERTSGEDRAIEILETSGSVIAITGGILGIAAAIKNLRGW